MARIVKKNQKKSDRVEIVEPEPIEEEEDIESEHEEELPEPVKKNKSVKKNASIVHTTHAVHTLNSQPSNSKTQPKSDQVVNDWNTMGDDISVEDVHANESISGNNSENEEEHVAKNTFRTGGKSNNYSNNYGNNNNGNSNSNRPQTSRTLKFSNSATNFNYQTYTDLETPVNELSNKDLVKVLIVRSHCENQYDFNKTMKTVLRAMNLECPMPGSRPPVDQSYQQSYQQPMQPMQSMQPMQPPHQSNPHQQYGSAMRTPSRNTQSGGKYQSQQQNMFGQRNQSKRTSDPHDF